MVQNVSSGNALFFITFYTVELLCEILILCLFCFSLNSMDYNIDMAMTEKDTMPMMVNVQQVKKSNKYERNIQWAF